MGHDALFRVGEKVSDLGFERWQVLPNYIPDLSINDQIVPVNQKIAERNNL